MNKTKGILLAILAAFIYGFTPILAKFTYLEGSNTISLTFYRSFLILPILYIILRIKKIPLTVTKPEIKKLAVLGSLGPTLTAITLYGAYNYISVGMTTTIHYIYPVFVAAFSIFIFKENISKEKIVALVLSSIGILLFFDGSISGSTIGILLAIGSGIAFGSHLLYVDKSGIKSMYPLKISFYTCLFSSIYTFIFGLATHNLIFKMSATGWLFTFIVAAFVSVIANTILLIAVKQVGPTVTAIVGMFEPITSIILGIIFFREPFTLKNILGCTFILISVLIIILSKEDKNSAESSEKMR